MSLKEKFCKYCNSFYFYEDGRDFKGVANTRQANAEVQTFEKLESYCPRCVDPHTLPGQSYEKISILTLFRKHLRQKGIDPELFDDEETELMLQEFQIPYELFHSNGTYRTVSILDGFEFQGKSTKFRINCTSPYEQRNGNQNVILHARELECLVCGRTAVYPSYEVLAFVLGFRIKACKSCDRKDVARNTSGLNRNGGKATSKSERAMAKALNVSRNDYRRHQITERVEPLPDGTIENGLRIVQSYWDDVSYTPKYKLQCDKCGQIFIVIQKHINVQYHFC